MAKLNLCDTRQPTMLIKAQNMTEWLNSWLLL